MDETAGPVRMTPEEAIASVGWGPSAPDAGDVPAPMGVDEARGVLRDGEG